MMPDMTERREIKQRSPAVWARVKAAYLAGEPAASVARRFDVGYGNLRYRAYAEGWTRKAAMAWADAGAAEETVRLAGQADAAALFAAPGDAPEPADPRSARRQAITRASALLAAGRAVEATAMLRAAESLARLTGDDMDGDGPADDGPLTPEQDAAREAAAKKGWNDLLDLIEGQADALARQLLADVAHAPAVHSGFVHAWRAQYLGPEAAAHDHARMQANAAHRVAFHWHDDGQPLPVDEVRAMYYQVFRQQIRARAGLPAVGPGDGDPESGAER